MADDFVCIYFSRKIHKTWSSRSKIYLHANF